MALHNVIRDDALEDLDFESDVQDEVLIQLKLIHMTWIWVHWVVLSLPLGFRYLVLSIMQCTWNLGISVGLSFGIFVMSKLYPRSPNFVRELTANKWRQTVDQSQRTRGFNVKNPPNAEGKNHGRQPANLHYTEYGYRMPNRRLTRGIYGVTLMCTAAAPPCVPGCWQAAQWASAALCPKSAFICVGLNLDHNSTPATWA